MGQFSEALATARIASGFKSARAFFKALSEAGADFDYSYYTRIEKGDLLPSPKIASTLVGRFNDPSIKEALIKAFCSEQFPGFQYLFKDDDTQKFDPDLINATAHSPTPTLLKTQQYLSPLQTNVISSSKGHYFAYLLVTLARRSLTAMEIVACTGTEEKECDAVIKDLLKAKVFVISNGQIDSFVKESHFPKRVDFPSLAKNYARLDTWDLEFGSRMSLNLLRRKFSLRRISPRSLPVILQMSDALIKLLEVSDDSKDERNSLVISFSQQINVGRLPG